MGYRIFLAAAPAVAFALVVALALLLRHRSEPLARSLALYASLCLWVLAAGSAGPLSPNEALALAFAKLEWAGLLLLPLSFGRLCLRYTGHDTYVPASIRALLFAIAAACIAAALTGGSHELFWRGLRFERANGLLAFRASFGPAFWLASFYSWATMAASAGFVLRAFGLSRGLHRRRSATILLGALLPVASGLVYALRLLPPLRKDFSPVGYGLSALAFFAGAYLVRAVRLAPLARGVVMEELDDGLLVLDPGGRIADFNLSAARMLALKTGDIGRLPSELPLLAFLGEGPTAGGHAGALLTARVGERHVQVKARAIVGSSGPRGTAYTLADVSDRVALQGELEAARADMLRRERFALIGRMAADIAHEINNPLGYVWSEFRSLKATIAGGAMVADPGMKTSSEAIEMIEAAEDGLSRIERVVRSLLDYSKRGSSAGAAPAPYDLARGIRNAVELLRGELDRFARVELDIEQLPPVMARGGELDQVVLNILRNAADAVRERYGSSAGRPGLITVRAWRDGAGLRCEMGNNGAPIPADIAGRLFDAFFSTKSDRDGIGLGLSISRDIVEKRHGGSLTLSSLDPVVFSLVPPL